MITPITQSNQDLVVGIDIQKASVIVSYLHGQMKDPVTVCVPGTDETRFIPMVIAKEQGIGRWYIGEDGLKKSAEDGAIKTDNLFMGAYEGRYSDVEGRKYSYLELFSTFIRRVIDEAGCRLSEIKKLVITVEKVDERVVELFSSVNSHLALPKDVLIIVDHKESFIYYTLSQNPNIHNQDVALFDYDKEKMLLAILSKDIHTRPQVISIEMDKTLIDANNRDGEFCNFIEKNFTGRMISSVFLIGGGFNEEWMDKSVDILCAGRRVFLGDNLYCKGACFAGRIRIGKRPWPYIYMGDHEMKMNISLKVSEGNEMSFVTLVSAGQNWYEAGGECEVILDGSPEFECWVQSPETRKAKISMIELNGLPKRNDRTTRLRISAYPLSANRINLTVRDLGFGDISPSTQKVWEHVIDIENREGTWEN